MPPGDSFTEQYLSERKQNIVERDCWLRGTKAPFSSRPLDFLQDGTCLHPYSLERQLATLERGQMEAQPSSLKDEFPKNDKEHFHEKSTGVACQNEMDTKLAKAQWNQANFSTADKQERTAMEQYGALLEGLRKVKGDLNPEKHRGRPREEASHSEVLAELQLARRHGEAEARLCQAFHSEAVFAQQELQEQRSQTLEILEERNLGHIREALKFHAKREAETTRLQDVEDLCLEQAEQIRLYASEYHALQQEFAAAKKLLVKQVTQIEHLRSAHRRVEGSRDAGAAAFDALTQQLAAAKELGHAQALEIEAMRRERSTLGILPVDSQQMKRWVIYRH